MNEKKLLDERKEIAGKKSIKKSRTSEILVGYEQECRERLGYNINL